MLGCGEHFAHRMAGLRYANFAPTSCQIPSGDEHPLGAEAAISKGKALKHTFAIPFLSDRGLRIARWRMNLVMRADQLARITQRIGQSIEYI